MKSRYIVCGIVQKGEVIALGRKLPGRAPYPDTWHLPGGGVSDAAEATRLFRRTDFDNAYFHAELRRELREELGVEVKNIRCVVPDYVAEPDEDDTLDKQGDPVHYYFLAYFCDYASGALTAGDDLAKAAWVPRAKLARYTLTPPSQKLFHEIGWLTYKNADGSVASPLDYLPLWPLVGTVAWQVAAPILVLGAGGGLLDKRLHTTPALLLLGIVASVGVSYILVRGTVRRMQAHVDKLVRQRVIKP